MSLVILLIKIFFARIIDVSLNTVRMMMIVRKNKKLATLIAFFEVLVWYYSAKSAIGLEESSILIAVFYALGYACGTFIGTIINDHFISNSYRLDVFTKSEDEVKKVLDNHKIKYFIINTRDDVSLFMIYIDKKNLHKIIDKIDKKYIINLDIMTKNVV